MTRQFKENFEGGGQQTWTDLPIAANSGLLITDDPVFGGVGEMFGDVVTGEYGASSPLGASIDQISPPDDVVSLYWDFADASPKQFIGLCSVDFTTGGPLSGYEMQARHEGGSGFTVDVYEWLNGSPTLMDYWTFSDEGDPSGRFTIQWKIRPSVDGLYHRLTAWHGQDLIVPESPITPEGGTWATVVPLTHIFLRGNPGSKADNINMSYPGEPDPPGEVSWLTVGDTASAHVGFGAGASAEVYGAGAGLSINTPHNLLCQGVGFPPGSPDTTTGPQRLYCPITNNNPDEGPNTRWLSYRIFDEIEPLAGPETGYLE